MVDRSDGIYAVVDGDEYRLTDATPFDDGTKCQQCDLMKDGKCAAPGWCLRIEREFTDSYWRRTVSVLVENDPRGNLYEYCYNAIDDGKTSIGVDCMKNTWKLDDAKKNYWTLKQKV